MNAEMKTLASAPLMKPEDGPQSRQGEAGAIGQHPSGGSYHRCRREWALEHILVPTDFSRSAHKALRYAVALAGRNGTQITLIHVIKPLPIDSEAYPILLGFDRRLTDAKSALRKACKEQHLDPPVLRNTLVRKGAPHREITDAARELEADLIILATNGYTGLSHVLLGGTTERVIRHAPCPVLVVRQDEREFVRR